MLHGSDPVRTNKEKLCWWRPKLFSNEATQSHILSDSMSGMRLPMSSCIALLSIESRFFSAYLACIKEVGVWRKEWWSCTSGSLPPQATRKSPSEQHHRV